MHGKYPLTSHGFKDATTDPDQVDWWWRRAPWANIGVATGPSGLVVVDLDGLKATNWWQAHQERHGAVSTLTAKTSRGLHLYFSGSASSTAGKLHPGVDTRGRGGYVVCPPSAHSTGHVYAWVTDDPVAQLPESLRRLLEPPSPKRHTIPCGNRQTVPSGEVTPEGLRRLNGIAAKVANTGEGGRHACLWWAARMRGALVTPASSPKAFALASCLPRRNQRVARRGRPETCWSPSPKASAKAVRCDNAARTTLELFRRWLHLPDSDVVITALAAVAANRMTGDPVWLLIVGPPGGGKTEILQAVASLPDVTRAGVLTEASLLSGTPKKEAAGSKGGLLREIGPSGILTLKDFGSILSMRQETRAALLAALREVYDGEWTRHVGTDGGRRLHWQGKLGLVAGCTPIIDTHHAVMASLGERFVLYRLTVDDVDAQARASLLHEGHEIVMRKELGAAVTHLFDGVDFNHRPPRSDADTDRLVALSTLVVRCRSAVERDRQSRDIELVPEAEAPARLVNVLARFLAAARLLGATDAEAWRVAQKIALDSMPAQRLAAIQLLDTTITPIATPDLAAELDLPTSTTRRVLEDLTAHHVLRRIRGGKGNADRWELTDWTRDRTRKLHKAYSPSTVQGDIAGTPPSSSVGNGVVEPETAVPEPSQPTENEFRFLRAASRLVQEGVAEWVDEPPPEAAA